MQAQTGGARCPTTTTTSTTTTTFGTTTTTVRAYTVFEGRDAPQELIDLADLVTEMREIKHPFTHGIKAQKGIEF
jgi:hypothetical protein